MEFEDCTYFNFGRDSTVLNAFKNQLYPKKLSTFFLPCEKKIEIRKTLIIFDEEARNYFVIAAG